MKVLFGLICLTGLAGVSFAGSMETCVLTGFSGNKCLYRCKSGVIIPTPAQRPDPVSWDEPTGACEPSIYHERSIPVRHQAEETASPVTEEQLIKKAAEFIKETAAREDSPFGAIDGHNGGLSAYRLTTAAANQAMETLERYLPGLHLDGKAYVDGGPALVMIVVSDDEPIIHMYDQDPKTGEMKRVDDFNVLGLAEQEDPQEADWSNCLMRLIDEDNSQLIPLGPGSADPYWWK